MTQELTPLDQFGPDVAGLPVLAVDPSIRRLGYALLIDADHPYSVGTVESRRRKDTICYHARALDMAHYLLSLTAAVLEGTTSQIDVIVETPANWMGARGMRSKDDEAIQKLYYFTGALIALFAHWDAVASVWVIEASQWKGQTPKSVMVKRAMATGVIYLGTPHDACEALLLALHALKHRNTEEQCIYEGHYQRTYPIMHDGQFEIQEWLENFSKMDPPPWFTGLPPSQ